MEFIAWYFIKNLPVGEAINGDRSGWACKHLSFLTKWEGRLKITNKALIYNSELMSDNFLVMKICTDY
jgi:hypothetical protein